MSSRTYVSSVERGIKTPTLTKIDELATVLRVHPLTLLTLSYGKSRPEDVERMLDQVRDEALGLLKTLHP